ncbi:MAG TPA: hypothetical protein VFL59_14615 [Candidatus Nanopelagicales bacterium]|nr:hypothetical protein [Candidatus Nanopelagicales bacterium]
MRRIAAVTLALALVPAIAACSVGPNAPTTNQGPSGNGTSKNQGPIALRGVTIVKGGAGLPIGTFVGTFVNTDSEPDVLRSVTITAPSGATTSITGTNAVASSLVLPALSSTQIGYQGTTHIDIKGLTIDPTAYATVTFTFAKAGDVTMPVMAVQPVGIYAGLGPITS